MSEAKNLTLEQQEVIQYRDGRTQFRDHWRTTSANPVEISIPVLLQDQFGHNHVDEFYRSWQIFGTVDTVKPLQHSEPRTELWRHRHGSRSGSRELQGELYSFLANCFVGAKVELTVSRFFPILGSRILVGCLAWSTPIGEKHAEENFVLHTPSGLITVPFSRVRKIRFLEGEDQRQFEALIDEQRMQRGENFVDISTSIQGKAGEIFTTSYTLSGQVPIFCYRLTHESQGPTKLHGMVRLTNVFARPWQNVQVKIPTTVPLSLAKERPQGRSRHREHRDMEMTRSNESMTMIDGQQSMSKSELLTPNVEELGDAHVFHVIGNLTLSPGGSALARLFSEVLGNVRPALYLNDADELRRSIQFTFRGQFIVPSAPCVVFQDGMGDGEGTLKLTRPGQNRIIGHANQQGVHFTRDTKKYETVIACHGNDDKVQVRMRHVQRTILRIENRTGKEHALLLDHNCSLSGDDLTVECAQSIRKTRRGVSNARFEISLPKSTDPFEVIIVELLHTTKAVEFAQAGVNLADWVDRYLFRSDEPEIMLQPGFAIIGELRSKIIKARNHLSQREREDQELLRRIEMMTRVLPAVGDAGWGEAADNRTKLTELLERHDKWLDEEKPKLQEDLKIDEGRLALELQKVKFESTADPKAERPAEKEFGTVADKDSASTADDEELTDD